MTPDRLVDLGPLAQLLLIGAAIAFIPLAWWYSKNRHATPNDKMLALAALTLFLTFDLVLFGAFTRLTGSGLGCPDWPGCYASATPMGASMHIQAAEQAMPDGPVTQAKAWIEMIHRKAATAIGGLIVVLLVLSVVWRQQLRVPIFWAAATLVWVCIQGAFGALTVTMKLRPAIVSLHLMGGLLLLALLTIQLVCYQKYSNKMPWMLDKTVKSPLFLWVCVCTGLVLMQVALGGWVSTNYAVLACTTFPSCQGSWWPVMDFAKGFELWRPLGVSANGEYLPFAALTAIHYTHRLAAFVVLGAMVLLAIRMRKQPEFRLFSKGIGFLAAWQLLSGLSNVVLGWPLIAALAHTGGAAACVVVLVALATRIHFSEVKPRISDRSIERSLTDAAQVTIGPILTKGPT